MVTYRPYNCLWKLLQGEKKKQQQLGTSVTISLARQDQRFVSFEISVIYNLNPYNGLQLFFAAFERHGCQGNQEMCIQNQMSTVL